MGSQARERVIRSAIILTSLLLVAWLLASGTTQLLAAVFFPTEDGAPKRRPRRAASDQPASKPRESALSIARSVLTRNIFDPETGSLTWEPPIEPVISDGDGSEGVGDPQFPNGEPLDCEGSLRLVASLVVPTRPELSFASLGDGGEAMLYRTGMRVGDSQLLGIREQRVFLQPSGRPLCQVVMFKPPDDGKPKRPARISRTDDDSDDAAKRPSRRERRNGLSDEELDQGITKNSDTSYTVNRGLVDKILGNQAAIMRSARIIPYEQNGRTVGVKVYGIRRNSLLGRLGMQNGDVLRTINGFDMTSPDSALEAYTRLRNADQISVSMLRRGSPSNLEYSIR